MLRRAREPERGGNFHMYNVTTTDSVKGLFDPGADVASSYFTVAETPKGAETYGGSQIMSMMSSSKK